MAIDPRPQPEGNPRQGGKRQEKRPESPGGTFRLVAFLLLLVEILFRLIPARFFGPSKGEAPPSPSRESGEGAAAFSSQPQGGPQRGGAGHETRDLSAPWVFGIVVFLAISGIAIQLILASMLGGLKRKAPPRDPYTPIERTQRAVAGTPPFPRLQVSPPADLQAFRQQEEAELNSYGWVNQSSGVVRLPIQRAMDLLLERGLPVREGTTGGKPGPSSYDLIQQRVPQKPSDVQGEK